MSKMTTIKEFCKKNKKEILGYTLVGLTGCIVGGVCVNTAMRVHGEDRLLLSELKEFGSDKGGRSMVQNLLMAQLGNTHAYVASCDDAGVPIDNVGKVWSEFADREGIDFENFHVRGMAMFGVRE